MIALPEPFLNDLVTRALEEDLQGGDLTTWAVVDPDTRAIARAVAGTPLIVCGGTLFARVFYSVDPGVRVEQLLADGEMAALGQPILVVEGAAASILSAERVALNFLQRLSGIATLTRRFVDAVPSGRSLRIADTRKTTPGLRWIERYAVRVGGAHNHRDSLSSAVLIKDNHILAAGSIREAIARARQRAPHTSRISVEVESIEALSEALSSGAEVVMLDNFDERAIAEAVRLARGKALVEVSGGITLERIPALAEAGVDVVSVGALTHSAKAADISLDLERLG